MSKITLLSIQFSSGAVKVMTMDNSGSVEEREQDEK
jgi:hypothetical protein